MFGRLVVDWCPADAAGQHSFNLGMRTTKEALMVGMRSDRARARARNLLATVYPAADDVEFRRLRELAIDYIQEAERVEAANRGREVKSDELISAALDAVARDYFSCALARARSQRRH
jgi:AcrR family transcriptional regulator